MFFQFLSISDEYQSQGSLFFILCFHLLNSNSRKINEIFKRRKHEKVFKVHIYALTFLFLVSQIRNSH